MKYTALVVLFVFSLLLFIPIAYADTTSKNGCKLTAKWDNKNNGIYIGVQCSLGIKPNNISKETKNVHVTVVAIPHKSNKGIKVKRLVQGLKPSKCDKETFLLETGIFNSENAVVGDKFDIEARFVDQRNVEIATITVPGIEWEKASCADFKIKAQYYEPTKDYRDGYAIITVSKKQVPGTANTRFSVSVDGGKPTNLPEYWIKEAGSDLAPKYVPSNPKDGQKYTFTMEALDNNMNIIKKESASIIWGNKSQVTIPEEGSTGESEVTPVPQAKADWSERLASSLIVAPAKWLLHTVGLYDPLELVYGDFIKERPDDYEDFEQVGVLPYLSTFTENEWNSLVNFFDKMNEFVPIGLVIIVVFMGVFYWYSSTVPDSRISMRQCISGLLLAMVLLRMGGMVFAFLFDVNRMLVAQFYGIAQDKITSGSSFLTAFISIEQDGYIGAALLFLIGVLCISVINWQYVMRKVVIAILIAIFPIVAVVCIVKRETIKIWFRELISNIFLQSAHAAVLALLMSFSGTGSVLVTSNFWFSLVTLLSLPAIAGLVRRVIGAESVGSGMGKGLAAGAGLASIFALGRALTGGVKRLPAMPGGPVATPATSTNSSSPASVRPTTRGFVGQTVATGGRMAAGLAGGVAGGMIAGPVGMGVGTGLGLKGASLFIDTAASLSGFVSQAKEDGIITALGMEDDVQKLDPSTMYDAGQKILGNNVLGKGLGTAMAAGSAIARPISKSMGNDSVNVLKGAEQRIETANRLLPKLQENLTSISAQKEVAATRYDRAKSLYGPNSERVVNAKKTIERNFDSVEDAQSYIDMYDRSVKHEQDNVTVLRQVLEEDPSNIRVREQYNEASENLNKLEEVKPKFDNVRNAVEVLSSTEYTDAKAEYENITAQEAEARLQVMDAQRAASRDGLKDYFKNIRENQ